MTAMNLGTVAPVLPGAFKPTILKSTAVPHEWLLMAVLFLPLVGLRNRTQSMPSVLRTPSRSGASAKTFEKNLFHTLDSRSYPREAENRRHLGRHCELLHRSRCPAGLTISRQRELRRSQNRDHRMLRRRTHPDVDWKEVCEWNFLHKGSRDFFLGFSSHDPSPDFEICRPEQ